MNAIHKEISELNSSLIDVIEKFQESTGILLTQINIDNHKIEGETHDPYYIVSVTVLTTLTQK